MPPKRKATSAAKGEAAAAKKKPAVAEGDAAIGLIDGPTDYEMESSLFFPELLQIYRTAAKKITAAVAVAYPKATVVSNGKKPRKGAFELSLGGHVLYSKLDSFGPAKNKAALPAPDAVIKLIQEHK